MTKADIAAVRTRAQARREIQQQQDNAATASSQAPITPLEAIPDLDGPIPAERSGKGSQEETIDAPQNNIQQLEHEPDTTPTQTHPADRPGNVEEESVAEDNPTNQPEPDYTVVTAPFNTATLIEEQKKDPQLKPMFDAAANPLQTDFIIKNDILYAVTLELKEQENPHKIVVPRSLQKQVLNVGHACSGHLVQKRHGYISNSIFTGLA